MASRGPAYGHLLGGEGFLLWVLLWTLVGTGGTERSTVTVEPSALLFILFTVKI